MTHEELLLWPHLRVLPWKFRRQEPIDRFVCDFVCHLKRLVVEVDGSQHSDNPDDALRDRRLAELGFTVVREENGDVLRDTRAVVTRISEVAHGLPDHQASRRPRLH